MQLIIASTSSSYVKIKWENISEAFRTVPGTQKAFYKYWKFLNQTQSHLEIKAHLL